MPRRTKREAAATRESVLIAALDLFSEKGYSRTTFNDIARRIDMSRGAVYWHFENKEALLAALIEFVHDYKQKLVESGTPEVKTLADLRAVFVMYARAVAENELIRKFEFLMHFQMEWSQELLSETHKKLNEIRQSPLERFKRSFEEPQIAPLLKEGTDLDRLVLALAAFWMGTCNMFLGGCPFVGPASTDEDAADEPWRFDFVEAIGDGFDLIMNGVLTGETNG